MSYKPSGQLGRDLYLPGQLWGEKTPPMRYLPGQLSCALILCRIKNTQEQTLQLNDSIESQSPLLSFELDINLMGIVIFERNSFQGIKYTLRFK